jgi:4-amino-4-deoxy-L-arabinose transferase-like glycosyltransferase
VGEERTRAAMTRSQFLAAILAILALATLLRTLYPVADPPWQSTVGVVWHDEGAWTHNARNRALFGAWRQDEWNPVYIAPVFTALEYLSFRSFGVGFWQARLVSEVAGVLSVLLLALGVRRIAGPLAGLVAGALLATNYVYVMYDRAAIMEALMVAFIVASWYCSTRAEKDPKWGALAGVCATLAFFTKAAAAFYVGSLFLLAVASAFRRKDRGLWTIGGLAASAFLIGVFFVVPHWTDYQFYNWQMSVTRKPSYDLASIVTRVTWFPILHDTFSRMWLALLLGVLGAWGILIRWRNASDGERLLVLWIAVGTAELLVHDVGNERRFVFLIPALIALASIVLARGSAMPEEMTRMSLRRALIAAPLILYADYVVWGALVRVLFLDDIYAHSLRLPVRTAAAAAVCFVGVMLMRWDRIRRDWTRVMWGPRTAVAITAVAVIWNIYQFANWAMHRTYENYAASRLIGETLPADTLVQGKLANGLALENRIRPIFIGHQFGNYADRKQRWDVRYILTYTDPELGYEGDQILDVLAAYPGWRTIMTFDVAETPSGHDKAALIEKRAGH